MSIHSLSTKKLLVAALLLNSGFFFIELFAAFKTNSLTLLADATHMLTDSISLLLVLGTMTLAQTVADSKRTFGYGRLEIFSSLINGLLLLITISYILYASYQRYTNPETVEPTLVVIIGVIGLLINLASAYLLHHDQQHSLNIHGAYLHLVTDAIGSTLAIISGLLIIYTTIHIIDVLFALLATGILLISVKNFMSEAINILLQGVPEEYTVQQIETALQDIDSVTDVHHTHIWAINKQQIALSTHIVINNPQKIDETLSNCHQLLHETYDIEHPTIQIETIQGGDHFCIYQ